MSAENSITVEEIPTSTLFPFLGAVIALGTLFYLFLPTLSWIANICWTDPDYSHGLLLPFISGYFLWVRREHLAQLLVEQSRYRARVPFSWIGFLLLMIAAPLFLMGTLSESYFSCWIAMFPALIGTLYLIFGTKLGGEFVIPVLMNLLAKPIPDSLVPKLFNGFQHLAAKGSTNILEMFHVPVHLMGNIIEIPGMRLLVEEACSGMRSLMALVTVGAVLIVMNGWSKATSVLVLIASILIAMVFNVLRVTLTAVLALYVNERLASGFFHSFSGLVSFLLGFVILYSFGNFVDNILNRKTTVGPDKLGEVA